MAAFVCYWRLQNRYLESREKLGLYLSEQKLNITKDQLYEQLQEGPSNDTKIDLLCQYYFNKHDWHADIHTQYDVAISGKLTSTSSFENIDKVS